MAAKRVAMVGTSLEARGGVAAVQRMILDHWCHDGFHIRHVATHVDGSRSAKAVAAGRALAVFLALLARGAVDVSHVHFSARASFFRKSVFILLSRLWGVPTIGHVHSGKFPAFYDGLPRVGRAYVRLVLNRLDRLVVLTEDWQHYYAALYRRGTPVILRNGVRVPEPAVVRSADGPPVILTLGRLEPLKGTYDILRAVPHILARVPDAEFWFGGNGELDEVRAHVADEPWADRVKLLGWLDDAARDRALRTARVLLLPSYAEGLPMAVLEAMAFNLPVVASSVGGIPRLIRHGETGMLIRPGDTDALAAAVVEVLADPERAERIGLAGRRVVQECYGLSTTLAGLAALYGEVLAEPVAAPPGQPSESA